MRVAELIKQLQTCHPDGEVVGQDYEPIHLEVINRQLILLE